METRGSIEYQKNVKVDGQTYKVVLLPPTRALKIAMKLTKLIGEPMAAMAGAGGDEISSAKALPAAVKALMERIDEDSVLDLIKEMIGTCVKENKSLNFEDEFHGRLGHLIKLFAAVLEVQFKDFFTDLAGMLKQSLAKT